MGSSGLEPLRGGSLFFNTKFSEILDIMILSQTNDNNDNDLSWWKSLAIDGSTCNPVGHNIKIQGKKVYSFSGRQVPHMLFFFSKIFQSPGIIHDPSSTLFKHFKHECLTNAFLK